MTAFEAARVQMVQAFIATGLWVPMSTVLPGCTEPTTFYGDFRRPDVDFGSGSRSTDFEIHYVHGDAATLKEDAEVIVADVLYRLREDPFVDPDRGADGYFRSAILTRVPTATAP